MTIEEIFESEYETEYSLSEGYKNGIDDQLLALENKIGGKLPEDYSGLLHSYGNCSIEGEKATIFFFSPDEIINKVDKIFEELLPGILIIGSNGGGYYYFYDLKNHFGKGDFSIYMADRGNVSIDGSYFVAQNITDLIFKIITAADF